MMKLARARWTEGLHFEVDTALGGHVAADGDDARAGARPTELLLTALAACTGMDVLAICRKKRQPVERYEVRATGEQAADHPQVFTAITVEHAFWGRDLEVRDLRRAIELSATRYCPVNAQIAAGEVRIDHRCRIGEAGGDGWVVTVVVTGPFGAVTYPPVQTPSGVPGDPSEGATSTPMSRPAAGRRTEPPARA
jgi:putative redox protein